MYTLRSLTSSFKEFHAVDSQKIPFDFILHSTGHRTVYSSAQERAHRKCCELQGKHGNIWPLDTFQLAWFMPLDF